ncbi:carboxypeptidase regulatory-like domain-containing protein [Catellatospora tritici]|uniref:carboxypeptidase regulatory-like domain-containing protein n=1 Tax=Catellatospora tritici TaxID=2851566 RepID=UPI001C2D8A5A|nr:carboxypeptidase regulatory-like domain-containing protein [Catellatospora tritici]MBV1853361.1 carboxypeptidase regulatory-like domain-containing protein [Catellatospora tritici]
MRRINLRRFGMTLLAVTVAAMGLVTPAHAEPGTGTISGQITDDGQPVVNAEVQVVGPGFGSALTGSDGRYEITGLPAGDYYTVFLTPPGGPTQYAYHSATTDNATQFTVTAGGTTTVNDTLIDTGIVAGRFTDPAGNGLAGIMVAAWSDPEAWSYVGTTDADGYYSVVVPTGNFKVAFELGTQRQWAPATLSWAQAQIYPVGSGQTVTVDATAMLQSAVAGRVVRADGTPYPDAAVNLMSTSGGPGAFGYTDADGQYRIDVMPGSYKIAIEITGEATEINQYVPGKRLESEAQVFTVAADSVTTVNETMLATGSASGRFTDAAGNGVPNVDVSFNDEYGRYYQATTRDDGTWQISTLLPGQFTVHFYDHATVDQYAYSKIDIADATRFTVVADQNLVVDDTKLATSGLRVTARDAITGAPVSGFTVQVGGAFADEANGAAVLPDLPVGTWYPRVYAQGYQMIDKAGPVTVVAGQQATLEVTLVPNASIRAKVVDAATGEPVAGVCLFTQTRTQFRLIRSCPAASGADGEVVLDSVAAGTYQIFALPDRNSVYGAQWVGLNGGTGDQAQARDVTVTAGQAKDIHKIYLDRKGTITGVVTGADGTPVTSGRVSIVTPVTWEGSAGGANIDADGRYTLSLLGPYSWPLFFQTSTHAWQWSGAAYRRQNATLIPVTAGQSTTFDQQLQLGTLLKVTVTGSPAGGYNAAYTSSNGDMAGYEWVPQDGAQVSFRVLGGGQVRLHYEGTGFDHGWYGGTDFNTAKPVSIPTSGEKVVVYPYS